MGMDGTSGIVFGDKLAKAVAQKAGAQNQVAGVDARTTRIPVALSPSDLDELTAALSSYIDRQTRSATVS